MTFDVIFYVGIMILALVINVAQAASAKRFSFRQGMSFFQASVYAAVILFFAITGGYDASFRFWTTVGFFLCALGEVAEVVLLTQNGVKAPAPVKAPESPKEVGFLDRLHVQKERIKRENPGLVTVLNVGLSLVLSVGISIVSVAIISGYISTFIQ
jgi:hypothetical protein